MTDSKIKIAFVKFGGLAAGGTEKYLQTLAHSLPPERFTVDYFYTHGVPLLGNTWIHPNTDLDRQTYMQESKVNLIHVECEARQDSHGSPYPWVNHNFFQLFNALDYDIVQTGRSGYPEYPFTQMPNSIFIDSIHGSGANGIEKRDNIFKTILLSDSHVARWIQNGGDASKVEIIPPLIDFPTKCSSTLREELNIDKEKFIFGMHQATSESVFSPIPLNAYSLIEDENNIFVILGGAKKYRQQAHQLGLKNVRFIDFTGDAIKINNFLEGLDIFAHGRHDGEMCSAAIIEALYHGKPIVSCPGINMGHAEQIDKCGIMTYSIEEYARSLKKFEIDTNFYKEKSSQCIQKYNNIYSLDVAINKYINIYEETYEKYKDEKYI